LQREGLQQFGERKGFDNQQQFDAASKSYQATKMQIKQGKFAEMADRAQSAAGDHQQQAQSTEVSSSKGRFAGMADRASAAAKPTPETGNGIKRDTGMEQG
ncbi:hypothetical protein GR268_48460, partial [Rhizobium leguminosarum]|nr:hypothetical protein [Rhizobium leguminosarum]